MPPTMLCSPFRNSGAFKLPNPGTKIPFNWPGLKPDLHFFENWWVVWKFCSDGVIIPQVAFPFHYMAKEYAKKIDRHIIKRYKDGKPDGRNYSLTKKPIENISLG